MTWCIFACCLSKVCIYEFEHGKLLIYQITDILYLYLYAVLRSQKAATALLKSKQLRYPVVNPLTAKLFNLNFHPVEVVSR